MVSNINGGLILVLPTYLLNLLCSYNNSNNNSIPVTLTGHFSPSKPLPPWKEPTNLVVNDTIYGMNRGTTLQSVLKLINSYEADTVIYTDGSATAGTTNGGYAVICTTGPAENPISHQQHRQTRQNDHFVI